MCVVGAVNSDLLIQVSPDHSTPGYALASGFSTLAGGKGLNTALTMAAVFPSRVGFVGRIGNDIYGDFLEKFVAESALEAVSILRDDSVHTGIGHVRVHPDGEYDTVVLPGANARVGSKDVEAYSAQFPGVVGWVSNLETPLEWLWRAREIGAEAPLAINLSPLTTDVQAALDRADVIVLNALEARVLTESSTSESLSGLLRKMRSMTKATVVITAGADGAIALAADDQYFEVDAPSVEVATTVGAGDAFFAVLSLGLNLGVSLAGALELAAEAGSLVASSFDNFLTPEKAQPIIHKFNEYLSLAGTP